MVRRGGKERIRALGEPASPRRPPGCFACVPERTVLDLNDWDILSVGVDRVRHNFERYDLLDDQVHFIEGWFRDTLAKAPLNDLAVLRLDGDLDESTIQGP